MGRIKMLVIAEVLPLIKRTPVKPEQTENDFSVDKRNHEVIPKTELRIQVTEHIFHAAFVWEITKVIDST